MSAWPFKSYGWPGKLDPHTLAIMFQVFLNIMLVFTMVYPKDFKMGNNCGFDTCYTNSLTENIFLFLDSYLAASPDAVC